MGYMESARSAEAMATEAEAEGCPEIAVGFRRIAENFRNMLKSVDRIDMISSDTQWHWEKTLQEYMVDYQRIMADIESDNAEINSSTRLR